MYNYYSKGAYYLRIVSTFLLYIEFKRCFMMNIDLINYTDDVNAMMKRYGVKFGIYKNGNFKEQLFPFDAIPRIIHKDEFNMIERGLIQRVDALNMFLQDVYSKKQIVKDHVIPEEFIFSSKGYFPQCEGITPPLGIYSHISGIDLVQSKDKQWYILEDNLRVPSGASYPLIAREITRRVSPFTFQKNKIVDNRNYGKLLKETIDSVNVGGINVILTPGRYNSAFFEHSYLAEITDSALCTADTLLVEDNVLYYKSIDGKKRVGSIYRRISDEYLDPITFLPESVIGIPNLMSVYKAGNVAIINSVGNGIADDKGIYYFVPKMIKYYLGQEPILNNAPTYLPYYEQDLKYVLDNVENLVIKDVSEAGGYGVVFGRDLDSKAIESMKALIKKENRRFIAQEIIDFLDLEVMEDGVQVPRKADLRAFVLSGNKTQVWASGLTRFSRNANSFVVNSSQGGGFKDTWVVE